MQNQSESSITHARNLAARLSVLDAHHDGDGDSATSIIRYSDGSTWYFDNTSATRLETCYGYRVANHGESSAWFLTRERAEEFNRDCGGIFDSPEEISADEVAVGDILR